MEDQVGTEGPWSTSTSDFPTLTRKPNREPNLISARSGVREERGYEINNKISSTNAESFSSLVLILILRNGVTNWIWWRIRSRERLKSKGESGHPCCMPLEMGTGGAFKELIVRDVVAWDWELWRKVRNVSPKPLCLRTDCKYCQMLSSAHAKIFAVRWQRLLLVEVSHRGGVVRQDRHPFPWEMDLIPWGLPRPLPMQRLEEASI